MTMYALEAAKQLVPQILKLRPNSAILLVNPNLADFADLIPTPVRYQDLAIGDVEKILSPDKGPIVAYCDKTTNVPAQIENKMIVITLEDNPPTTA